MLGKASLDQFRGAQLDLTLGSLGYKSQTRSS